MIACSAARSLVIALAALGAGGCGMFPTPKFLDGRIEGTTYTSEDGRFAVMVPQAKDDYELLYLNVKEEHQPQGEEYVSFGPAAFDRRFFRVDLAWWPADVARPVSFQQVADYGIANYRGQLEQGYGVAPAVEPLGPDTIGAHPALAWRLEHVAPAGTLSNKPTQVRHELWAIDMGAAAAMVAVEWYPDLAHGKVSVEQARQFAESLVLH
jgi:hypothetical protein